MIKRLTALAIIAVPLLAQQAPRPGAKSQRPADTKRIRTTIMRTLGWNVGIPAGVFRTLTFSEAAGMADAMGLGSIEASSTQKVSSAINKNFDYNLSAEEIASVKARLNELRLKLPAYYVDSMGDEGAARRVFTLAKALDVETVVAPLEAASLPVIDKLANEFGMNFAVDASADVNRVMAAIEGRSKRIGVSADVGKWLEAGIEPVDALPMLKDRLMVAHLRDRDRLGARGNDVVLGRGAANLSRFLMDVVRQAPAIQEFPGKCANCYVGYTGAQALFVAIDAKLYNSFEEFGVNGGSGQVFTDLLQSVEGFEQAVRPAMGFRVQQDSVLLPSTSADTVPANERQPIEAGVPRRALAVPKKPRKLLVIDLCPLGDFHHLSIAHTNLAIQLMAKNTGAFEPVFSNDMNNLKYPAITQFDAVLFNSTVGEILIDPDVIGGLTRFVREGGGVAGIHAATYGSMNLPEFGEMMGGVDGPHRVEPATIKIEDLNSPLTKGFDGQSSFAYTDEFYHFLPNGPFSRDKVHVLVSIDTDKSDMSRWNIRPDKDYALVWIKTYGKGRVFNSAMGHMPSFFATPALAQMVLGGIQFVLGDLDADTTPSSLIAAKK